MNPAQGIVDVKEDNTLYSSSKYSLFGYGEATKGTSADEETSKLEFAIEAIQSCIKADSEASK